MAVKEKDSLNAIKQYAPAQSRESIKRKYGIEHLIKLAGNENRLGYSPKVNEAIEAYISNKEQISLYPDGNVTVLREKVAN
ncbi:MAG: histidinol-phosphate transaminase, partial [Lachnospiraceae bacterium]|nr:histidinol-phosphate transaminase [Lachnospiraceae bacterium]